MFIQCIETFSNYLFCGGLVILRMLVANQVHLTLDFLFRDQPLFCVRSDVKIPVLCVVRVTAQTHGPVIEDYRIVVV